MYDIANDTATFNDMEEYVEDIEEEIQNGTLKLHTNPRDFVQHNATTPSS